MSVVSNIPFFGQSYELTVGYATPGDGTNSGPPVFETLTRDDWEPEALRITFDVQSATIVDGWWYADIIIYNLNTETIAKLVHNAAWVTLKAGFQTGPTLSSVIWDGPILQILYDQENVVDQRVTLHCVANPIVEQSGVVSFSMGVNASQADLLVKAANAINLPDVSQANGTLSATAQQSLSAKAYPRGNTVFGKMGNFMSLVANDQGLQTWRDGYKMYMSDLGQPGAAVPPPSFTFSPPNPPGSNLPIPAGVTPTIIGTPRQTPQGVVFTVLLDPRVKVQIPPVVVQLVRTLPGQLAIQPNPSSGNMATPLNANLLFFIGQVKHVGDSRGNDWYTEITGYSTTYAQSLLDGVFSGSSK
jgi:hypothetical protein